MNKNYHPADIEPHIQAFWEEEKSFYVKEDLNKEKFYCLSMLPYPSGELHMGHVRNYTIGDVISRYQIMQGKNVLQPMAWDAFGLPAENAAIKHKLAPSKWTAQNIKEMRAQLKQLGFAFDWKREYATSKPNYYRWEQWLFIKLFKKGLVYRKNAMVNWDPVDKTVLANEQVINGRGWRSGELVERREIPQWFIKITQYADELLDELDNLPHWPEKVRTMQTNWIGRSQGVSIDFAVADSDSHLSIFTTCPNTLLGVTYLAIAVDHPLAEQAAQQNPAIKQFIKDSQHIKMAEAELAHVEKAGIETDYQAIHPITGKSLPIWIANYVLMEYGSGAVMAVPAHDERDHEFSQKYQLPIHPVITPADGHSWDFAKGAYTGIGTMINSEQFDGMPSEQANTAITEVLVAHDKAKQVTHYRLRDWGVSRQRYWGTPIPIVYCPSCGAVPVAEDQLPVVLPENIVLKAPGSPLKNMPEFYQTTCPHCGEAAHRETDTMDTFMESSWYYARNTCPDQNKVMLDDRANYWTPVDHYIGGVEHAVLHLLYARFMHKLLRDEGLVNSDEPFTRLLTQGMVLKDGSKMSKSKGNTVSPQSLVKKYGADTVRLFIIFASPPEQSLEWSDSGVEGGYRFLKRLWGVAHAHHADLSDWKSHKVDWQTAPENQRNCRREVHHILKQACSDYKRIQFNTVVSAAMKLLNIAEGLSNKNDFEQSLTVEILSILLRLMAPITPHLSQHLWVELGFGDNILHSAWPKVNSKALKVAHYAMVVQINGKLRAKITAPVDATKEDIEKLALQNEKVIQFIADKTPKKIIVVPEKLVNIVI